MALFGNLFKEDIGIGIIITEPLRQRYELTISSTMRMGEVINESNIQYKVEIFLQKVTEEQYYFTLLTLEHNLLKSNSTAFDDMFNATKKMMQILSELRLVTNRKGEIIEVKNHAEIVEKWRTIKEESINIGATILKISDMYDIKENELQQPSTIKKMVSNMEFMDIFFGIYGRKMPLPYETYNSFIWHRQNIFRNLQLPFFVKLDIVAQSNKTIELLNINATCTALDKSIVKKAYSNIPYLQNTELRHNFKLQGNYTLNKQNKLIQNATIETSEDVADNLQSNITYNLKNITP